MISEFKNVASNNFLFFKYHFDFLASFSDIQGDDEEFTMS